MTSGTSQARMRQLDALRFFAIAAVLVDHLWQPVALPWIFGAVKPGVVGVRLFLVLSGFLITSILLRGIDLQTRHARRTFVSRFYLRRVLRICPVYFLCVGLVVLADIEHQRHLWAWFAGFATNIYIFVHPLGIGTMAPLWSLAVQEQFYLVWPILLLFLPRRWLVPTVVLLIAAAPVFRVLAVTRTGVHTIAGSESTIQVLAPSVMDSLAVGALAALAVAAGLDVRRLARLLAPFGAVLLLVLLAALHYAHAMRIEMAFRDTALALMLGALVLVAAPGFTGVAGRVLSFRPLVYLGRISYGIYIFHMIVPTAYRVVARHSGFTPANGGFVFFAITSVATIAVAVLSWELLEHPINELKRYFPYTVQERVVVPPPSSAVAIR